MASDRLESHQSGKGLCKGLLERERNKREIGMG